MALKEYKAEKIYYTMGEVTEMFDVNATLIRFWEQRFDVLRPRRNKKGNRLFTPDDVKNLEIIHHLVKERGMTLAGADKYLKANKKELDRDTEIVRRLQTIRGLLAEIREELSEPAEGTRVILTSVPEPEAELAEELLPEPPAPEPLMPAPPPEPEEEHEPLDAAVSEPFTAQPLFEIDAVAGSPAESPVEAPEAEDTQAAFDFHAADTQQSLF